MPDRINEKYPDRSTPSAIRSIRIINQLVPEIAGTTGVVINVPTMEPQIEILEGELYRPKLVTESVPALSRSGISEPTSVVSITNPQLSKAPEKVSGSVPVNGDTKNIIELPTRSSDHPLRLLERRKKQLGQTTDEQKAA